ncbi:MAG TPA: TatD family hydrolase [Candidatus Paceibacterota bacterium]
MTPKYFDAHGHPNFIAYKDDRDEVIKRALEAGVWMTAVGTQQDTSKSAVELAEKYQEGVYAIIGLHPIHTDKSFHDENELGPSFAEATKGKEGFTSRGEQFDYDFYKKLAESRKVVAIGECGLDYYRLKLKDSSFKENEDVIKKQEENFRRQIELAIEVKKPLMLHLRNGQGISAYNQAFSILKSYNLNLKSGAPGDLHFFAGSFEEAKPFLDLGFNFSFTGVITFTHDYDEIIKKLPLERIMAETDCPYVTPAPYRGKRNEPKYVEEVVKAIATIRGEDFEKVRETILQNTLRFFNIKI